MKRCQNLGDVKFDEKSMNWKSKKFKFANYMINRFEIEKLSKDYTF